MPRRLPVLALLLLWPACTSPSGSKAAVKPEPVTAVTAEPEAPRILVVVAHPDDEIAFAGTLYKTSTFLGGACDVLLITNGEGGYKYSTLAERLYDAELTDEAIGRARLPTIRQREFVAGCRIMGVRDVFLLNQRDHRYTRDVTEVLGPEAEVWDLEWVEEQLRMVLDRGDYDFVLTHTPTPGTHAHHKAASILALEAVAARPLAERPVILCVRGSRKGGDPSTPFTELEGFPITRVDAGRGALQFDRSQPFGFRDRLDYKIVVNWAIAEHKSQGTMQRGMNGSDYETYHLYAINRPDAEEQAAELFRALQGQQFETKTYPGEVPRETASR